MELEQQCPELYPASPSYPAYTMSVPQLPLLDNLSFCAELHRTDPVMYVECQRQTDKKRGREDPLETQFFLHHSVPCALLLREVDAMGEVFNWALPKLMTAFPFFQGGFFWKFDPATPKSPPPHANSAGYVQSWSCPCDRIPGALSSSEDICPSSCRPRSHLVDFR